jgi:hypothetical protein
MTRGGIIGHGDRVISIIRDREPNDQVGKELWGLPILPAPFKLYQKSFQGHNLLLTWEPPWLSGSKYKIFTHQIRDKPYLFCAAL